MGFVDSFNISNDKKETLKELALLEDNWIGGGYGEAINDDTLKTVGFFLQDLGEKAAENTLLTPMSSGGVVATHFEDITNIKESNVTWSIDFYNDGEVILFLHGNHDKKINFDFTQDDSHIIASAMVKIIADHNVLNA